MKPNSIHYIVVHAISRIFCVNMAHTRAQQNVCCVCVCIWIVHCIEMGNRARWTFRCAQTSIGYPIESVVLASMLCCVTLYTMLCCHYCSSLFNARSPLAWIVCIRPSRQWWVVVDDGGSFSVDAANATFVATTAPAHYMHPHASTTIFGNVFWVAVLLLSM